MKPDILFLIAFAESDNQNQTVHVLFLSSGLVKLVPVLIGIGSGSYLCLVFIFSLYCICFFDGFYLNAKPLEL